MKFDTWSWNGTSWTLLQPTTAPRMAGSGMTYDAASESLVLFGMGEPRLQMPQTWTWEGASWVSKPSSAAPSLREQFALTYDAAHSVVLLFGGFLFVQTQPNDTWTWNGNEWQQRHPLTNPPGGPAFAAYDALHRNVVLFTQGQTWTWDGTNWTQQHPATSPANRIFASMAYDPAVGRIFLFGGKSLTTVNGAIQEKVNNELWSWDGTNWWEEA